MKDITNTALYLTRRTPTKTPIKSPQSASSTSSSAHKNKVTKPSPISETVVRKTLQKKVSRLELLDDSRFTSFPLAPPAPLHPAKTPPPNTKKTRKSPYHSNHRLLTPSKTYNNCKEINNTPSDYDGSSLMDYSMFAEDNDDESITEPIVLIEDYIKPTKTLGRNRKISVLDLKGSIDYQDSNYLNRATTVLNTKQLEQFHKPGIACSGNLKTPSITDISNDTPKSYVSSLLLTTNIDIDNISTPSGSSSFKQTNSSSYGTLTSNKTKNCFIPVKSMVGRKNITEILPDTLTEPKKYTNNIEFIPNNYNNELKSCIICDKPLYDLSSLLKRGAVRQDEEYNEIVCSSCTDRYEKLSKLIDIYDVQNISDGEEEEEDAFEGNEDVRIYFDDKAYNKVSFSQSLIQGLQNQLNPRSLSSRDFKSTGSVKNTTFHTVYEGSTTNTIDIQWLKEAKKKLRWRWRITGLLPRFLMDSGSNTQPNE